MLTFFKFQDGDNEVVINPIYVAHMNNEGKKETILTMCDGRRYSLPTNETIKLSEQLEKIANYNGC